MTAFTTSLKAQVVNILSVFVTSSFGEHSLISTVMVVQKGCKWHILFRPSTFTHWQCLAVIKPPMTKVARCFRSTRRLLVKCPSLRSRLYPDGDCHERSNIRCSPDLLLRRKHGTSNPSAGLHCRHFQSAQPCPVVQLARSSIFGPSLDWVYHREWHSEVWLCVWLRKSLAGAIRQYTK